MLRFLSACLAAGAVNAAPAQPISFALIGDAPYNRAESIAFDQMVNDINADADVRFILHAGDIKGSGEPCSDELLTARIAQLQRFARPLMITPGDNEWTDCHRARAGRWLPTERLARLRELMIPNPRTSLGQEKLALESQTDSADFPEFVENWRFERDGVIYAALHVVGSQNGRQPWSGIDPQDKAASPRADRMAEVERREAAVAAWVDSTFARAHAIDARAVVLLMQANPQIEKGGRRRAPYNALIEQIETRAAQFKRPVLWAHGDEHEYFVDRPLPVAPQLTRVQTFGSPAVHWIEVRIDPASATVFSLRPHHVRAPGQD
ncbi:MAG: hypothetical protein RR240_08910 [Burkholderiaceae bacterium]